MARPSTIPYNEIIAKYQTGQYSITKLSKEYNVSKSTLSEYIKRNNIGVSEQAEQAINHLNKGFSELSKIVSEQDSEHSNEVEIINPTLVVGEILDVVKKNNPQFLAKIQFISNSVLNKCKELLENETLESKDIKNITGALKDINDTLQVIPKPPAIAQQFNFTKQDNTNKNVEIVEKIEFEFMDNDNESESI